MSSAAQSAYYNSPEASAEHREQVGAAAASHHHQNGHQHHHHHSHTSPIQSSPVGTGIEPRESVSDMQATQNSASEGTSVDVDMVSPSSLTHHHRYGMNQENGQGNHMSAEAIESRGLSTAVSSAMLSNGSKFIGNQNYQSSAQAQAYDARYSAFYNSSSCNPNSYYSQSPSINQSMVGGGIPNAHSQYSHNFPSSNNPQSNPFNFSVNNLIQRSFPKV